MHPSPWSVQLDWCELSRTTVYTVNTKYRAIHKLSFKKKEKESKETTRSSQWIEIRRAHASRGRRMEFTSTNSISVWEKTRSSARSSMHAPRGKYIPENAGHRSSSLHRASRCYRGKNRAALKDDILVIRRDGEISPLPSLSFSLFLDTWRLSTIFPEIFASRGVSDNEI